MRQVLVYPDPDSEWWIAEVPSLRGCVSQGRTQSEALQNAKEAAHEWITTAKSLGWEIPAAPSTVEIHEIVD